MSSQIGLTLRYTLPGLVYACSVYPNHAPLSDDLSTALSLEEREACPHTDAHTVSWFPGYWLMYKRTISLQFFLPSLFFLFLFLSIALLCRPLSLHLSPANNLARPLNLLLPGSVSSSFSPRSLTLSLSLAPSNNHLQAPIVCCFSGSVITESAERGRDMLDNKHTGSPLNSFSLISEAAGGTAERGCEGFNRRGRPRP